MRLDVSKASELADGNRCMKCGERKYRGLCPCERASRAAQNIEELEAWQAQVGEVEGLRISAVVGAAINRELHRAGLNDRPLIGQGSSDDPNAQLMAAQAVRMRRRNTTRQPAVEGKKSRSRDPFRWQPYRRQEQDEFPLAP